jgi:hypothetical protein
MQRNLDLIWSAARIALQLFSQGGRQTFRFAIKRKARFVTPVCHNAAAMQQRFRLSAVVVVLESLVGL